jgi:hypothetical protein
MIKCPNHNSDVKVYLVTHKSRTQNKGPTKALLTSEPSKKNVEHFFVVLVLPKEKHKGI